MRFLRLVGVTAAMATKVIIVPGIISQDGDNKLVEDNENYTSLRDVLKENGVDVVLSDMPEPWNAYKHVWLPFIKDVLAGGEENLENCILIGHSSGALAAMRLAEKHKIKGIILVAGYYDVEEIFRTPKYENTPEIREKFLNLELATGYFEGDWEWAKMTENCGFLTLVNCDSDLYIPIDQAEHINEKWLETAKDGQVQYVKVEMGGEGSVDEVKGPHHFDKPCEALHKICIKKCIN